MRKLELFEKVKSGNDIIVKKLLDVTPALINTTDECLWTPLHWASSEGLTDITTLLLSRGANVNARDQEGETPLFCAAESSIAILQILLRAGADANSRNDQGQTPLHKLAYYGEYAESEYLIDKGAEINTQDNNGMTPLHYAALSGLHKEASLLIAKGADVNARDNRGYTPLHTAVHANFIRVKLPSYIATITKLIHEGSDIKARTSEGRTLLELAYYEEIKNLLIHYGA